MMVQAPPSAPFAGEKYQPDYVLKEWPEDEGDLEIFPLRKDVNGLTGSFISKSWSALEEFGEFEHARFVNRLIAYFKSMGIGESESLLENG